LKPRWIKEAQEVQEALRYLICLFEASDRVHTQPLERCQRCSLMQSRIFHAQLGFLGQPVLRHSVDKDDKFHRTLI
jgi:uncharacterized glyoxalase superfamily protein PhnB